MFSTLRMQPHNDAAVTLMCGCLSTFWVQMVNIRLGLGKHDTALFTPNLLWGRTMHHCTVQDLTS